MNERLKRNGTLRNFNRTWPAFIILSQSNGHNLASESRRLGQADENTASNIIHSSFLSFVFKSFFSFSPFTQPLTKLKVKKKKKKKKEMRFFLFSLSSSCSAQTFE